MKKEYTFKLNNVNCELCGNQWLYLDKTSVEFKSYYVCKCAKCGNELFFPSSALILVIKEHLREVRRNEDNY